MSDKDKRGAFTTVVISDIENNTQEVVYNSYTLPLLFYNGTDMTKNIEKIEAVPDKGITIQNDIIFYDNIYESAEDTFEFVMITMKELEGSQTHSLAELIENGFTITPFINCEGGGDSDFSTATVTFVNSTVETDINISIPVIYEGALETGFTVTAQNTKEREVILYKGLSASGNALDSNQEYVNTATVTGDIEFDEGTFNVSGEGTITF